MSISTFPPVSELPSLDTHQRAAVLDTLFEPCDQLHTLSVDTLRRQAFESYDDMIASIGVQMSALAESTSTSDTVWLDAILAAHPRLGAAKVDSAQSRAEQAQLNQGGLQEADMLTQLNQQYETTFPGLRYVVFVNGRRRGVIMDDMRTRIARNDIQAERVDSIRAMCEIAADRARKLTAAP